MWVSSGKETRSPTLEVKNEGKAELKILEVKPG
jgi:hypothetical protein